MMMVPAGVKVHLALGHTDMRKGIDGSITLTPAQLAMLIEGIDWRTPERVWRPVPAG